ncbi:hypothetical protein FRC18_007331 [Serendipita sp. 400]|nr:hypothetical protein FRC18_007331 [Serendipita sp. 400]
MPMPMSMSSSSSISRATSGSGSGSGSGSLHADSTPRALKTSKALPPTTTTTTADLLTSGAMTMGRVSGSNAMMVERKEKEGGVRRSSVGANADSSTTTTATTTTPSRRRGDLKIPTMISMKQGALKRELEAVKEFATGVEDLKRLQSSYQSMVSHVSKGRNTSSRTAARQLSVVENIGSQYSIWWECADLLIELGGAAPPTVAGTPMYENENPHLGGNSNAYAGRTDTISMSSAHSYGTQRSHTSTSSNGDLSNRQLQLLRQMLMTPNPRSFHDPALLSHPMKPSGSQATLSSEYSSTQSAEMSGTPSRLGHRRGELSGSGSDHMMSDMGSRRGTKSSIDSGDSTHRSTREFVLPTNGKSPYTPGTWRDKAGKSSSSNRPSLAGMFAKPTDATASSGSNARSSKGAATASRGTLDGSNSSAAGRGTTDDDDDISDWDAESETGDKPSSLLSGGGGSRYLTTPSTTSSSFDALPTKLALTPENIAPLLEYAREVKVRLYDCLDRLSRELKAASSSSSSSGAAPPSAHMSSRDRSTTTTTAGTSSMKRA